MKKHWKQFTALFLALAMIIVSGVVVTNNNFKASNHVHDDSCYGEAQGDEIICGMVEHQHTDECFPVETETIYKLDDEGNYLMDENGNYVTEEVQSRAMDPQCGMEEHLHDMSCYSQITTLICGYDEATEEGVYNLTIVYQFKDWDAGEYIVMPQYTSQHQVTSDGQIVGGAITTPFIEDENYYYVVDDVAKDSRGGWNGTMDITYQNYVDGDAEYPFFARQAIINQYLTGSQTPDGKGGMSSTAPITGDMTTEIWYLRYPKPVLDEMIKGEEPEEGATYNFHVIYKVLDAETGEVLPFANGQYDFSKAMNEDGSFVEGAFNTVSTDAIGADMGQDYMTVDAHLYRWDDVQRVCQTDIKFGGDLKFEGQGASEDSYPPVYKNFSVGSYQPGNDGGKITHDLAWEIILFPLGANEEAPKTLTVKYVDDKGNTIKEDSEPRILGSEEIPAATEEDTQNIVVDDKTYVNVPDKTKTETDEAGNTIITLVFSETKEPVKYVVNYVDDNNNPIVGLSSEERSGEDGQEVSATDADKADKTLGTKVYEYQAEMSTETITLDKDGNNVITLVFKEKVPYNLTVRYDYADRNPSSATYGQWIPIEGGKYETTVPMRADGTLPGGAVANPYLPAYTWVDAEIERIEIGAQGNNASINFGTDSVAGINPNADLVVTGDYVVTLRYEKTAQLTVKYVYENENGENVPMDGKSDDIRILLGDGSAIEKVTTPIFDGFVEFDTWIEDANGATIVLNELEMGNSEILGLENVGTLDRDYTVIVKYVALPEEVAYTVTYKDEEGNELKAPATRHGIEDDVVTATAVDTQIIEITDPETGKVTKYQYVSGNKDLTLTKGGDNTINLVFKKVEEPVYTLTVKYYFDGVQKAEYPDIVKNLNSKGGIEGVTYEDGQLSGPAIVTPVVEGYMLFDASIVKWEEGADEAGKFAHITNAYDQKEISENWNPGRKMAIVGVTLEKPGTEINSNYVMHVDYLSMPGEDKSENEAPTTPVTPGPTDPTDPVNPGQPGNQPETTPTPNQPQQPNQPQTPGQPQAPNQPQQPTQQPQNPAQPQQPAQQPQQTPDQPQQPAQQPQQTPDQPQQPAQQPQQTPDQPQQATDDAVPQNSETTPGPTVADTAETATMPQISDTTTVTIPELADTTTVTVVTEDGQVAEVPVVAIADNGTTNLTMTPINDLETPLADMGLGHICNILYFLILLASVVVLAMYFSSAKKHQQRIFELRGELGEDDPYRKDQ